MEKDIFSYFKNNMFFAGPECVTRKRNIFQER